MKIKPASMLHIITILGFGAIVVHGESPNERDIQLVNTTRNSAVYTGPYIEVLRGRDGRDGRDGKDGKDGEKGKRGDPGIEGPQGPTGSSANQGASGSQGPPGSVGPAGPPGPSGPQGPPGSQGIQGPSLGGAVYTRWGRTTCADTPGTKLVYAGRAAGTHYGQSGGGANYLCMPDIPEYIAFQAGNYGASYLFGAEFETWQTGPFRSMHQHNIPCAVCHVETRAAMLTLPARISCPATWTREYYGYLMTAHRNHKRAQFECVDVNAESIPGSAANNDGTLFCFVEATCTGLPCPPYDTQKEVTCAVCTK